MKKIIFLIGISFSWLCFSSQDDFHLQNKLALNNFGLGVVEALYNPTAVENGPLYSSYQDPDKKLITKIEKYPGFEVSKINLSERSFVNTLAVTREDLNLPFAGSLKSLTLDEIIMELGPPDFKDESKVEYTVPNEIDSDKIIFFYSKSKIKSIKWIWNLD